MNSRVVVVMLMVFLVSGESVEIVQRIKKQIEQQYDDKADNYQLIISTIDQIDSTVYFVKYHPQKIYKVIVKGDQLKAQMIVNNQVQFFISGGQLKPYRQQNGFRSGQVKSGLDVYENKEQKDMWRQKLVDSISQQRYKEYERNMKNIQEMKYKERMEMLDKELMESSRRVQKMEYQKQMENISEEMKQQIDSQLEVEYEKRIEMMKQQVDIERMDRHYRDVINEQIKKWTIDYDREKDKRKGLGVKVYLQRDVKVDNEGLRIDDSEYRVHNDGHKYVMDHLGDYIMKQEKIRIESWSGEQGRGKVYVVELNDDGRQLYCGSLKNQMMWTMSIDSNEFEIEIESEVKKGYDGGWGQNMMIRHQKVYQDGKHELIFQDNYKISNSSDQWEIEQGLAVGMEQVEMQQLLEEVMGKNNNDMSESIFMEGQYYGIPKTDKQTFKWDMDHSIRWVTEITSQIKNHKIQMDQRLQMQQEIIKSMDQEINQQLNNQIQQELDQEMDQEIEQSQKLKCEYSTNGWGSVYKADNMIALMNRKDSQIRNEMELQMDTNKLMDVMKNKYEKRQQYYQKNCKELLLDMTDNDQSSNIGLIMKFDESTNEMNGCWSENGFEYIVMRKEDNGKYRSIYETIGSIDQENKLYRVEHELSKDDIIIIAQGYLFYKVDTDRIAKIINNHLQSGQKIDASFLTGDLYRQLLSIYLMEMQYQEDHQGYWEGQWGFWKGGWRDFQMVAAIAS